MTAESNVVRGYFDRPPPKPDPRLDLALACDEFLRQAIRKHAIISGADHTADIVRMELTNLDRKEPA